MRRKNRAGKVNNNHSWMIKEGENKKVQVAGWIRQKK